MNVPSNHIRWSLSLWMLTAGAFTTCESRADTLDQIRQRGALVWGGDAEGGGPFIFPRDDDPTQVQGFEVELAELLARHLSVRAQFQQGQWEKLPDLLERGDIDIVINGYEWTPVWGDRFGATIPYYLYELQMLVRRSDDRLKSLEDLRPTAGGRKSRIAVLGGSAAETFVKRHYSDDVDVVVYEGNSDAMRAVELGIGGADATLQDLPIATFYEARFPGLRQLGDPVSPGFYVVLARRADASLVQALNQAILACWLDGSFPAVLRKYGLWNESQKRRGLMVDPSGNFRPDIAPLAGDGDQVTPAATSSWRTVLLRFPLLLRAAGITVALSVLSMPLAILIGLAIAVGRMYGPKALGKPLGWYVELIRGTPLVLQLYVIFFLLPELGLTLPAFVAAVMGLAINYSAYEAEIYRAGLQAIPRGQMEAALSLGMSRWLAIYRIIVPQAMRIVIPPITNDFIALFKDTAVCSVITVVELSKEYYIHARSTGAVLQLGICTAILYLAMSYPLSLLTNYLERRMSKEYRRD